MRLKIPRDGDIKIKRKFAFLPVSTYEEIRWLEWVTVQYEYNGRYRVWCGVKFIDEN